MRILVTGASGFVGSELIPRVRSDGHRVRAMARDPARVDPGIVESGAGAPAEVCVADALTGEGLERALEGVEVAYYLIHSMERPRQAGGAVPFAERERRCAEQFAAAAAAAGVNRIVYLGGPTRSWLAGTTAGGADGIASGTGERAPMSDHLRSREAVARVLRAAVPDTVALRASIVIAARSRSFRFMVRLIERMPVLALPPWRKHRTRPIDGRDAIEMLVAAATVTSVAGRSLDVGGPQILTYGEMFERIAELMLVSRPVVDVGVSVTPITAPIAAAIAGEDPQLVGALMESLQGDLLPDGPQGRAHLRAAAALGVELHSFDDAVEHALREWEAMEPLAAR